MNRKNIIFFSLIFIIFLFGCTLRFDSIFIPYQHGPDESVYTQRASQILQHGRIASVQATYDFNHNQQLWCYPSPTRVGYLWLVSGVMYITHQYNFYSGMMLSFVASVLSMVVLAIFGLQFFNYWTTALALLFYAVSPVSIAMAGRALQESVVELFGVMLAYLFAKTIKENGKLVWLLPFIVVGSCGYLVKETLLVFYALLSFALIIFFITNWIKDRKNVAIYKIKILYLIIFGFCGLFFVILIQDCWCGGLENILLVTRHVKWQMPYNNYAVNYQSGPWYQMFYGMWIMSPLMSIGFLITGCLFSYRLIKDFSASYFIVALFFSSIIYFIFIVSMPFVQNMRYVSVLFGLFYLLAADGICWLLKRAAILLNINKSKIIITVIIGIIVTIAFWRDLCVYNNIFKRQKLYDPAMVVFKQDYKNRQ